MREEDLRESSDIEDRRGMATGGLGIGAVVARSLTGWAFGINPAVPISGAQQVAGNAPSATQAPVGRRGTPDDETGRFVARVLDETEDAWPQILPREANGPYERPALVLQAVATASAIGDDRLSQAAGRAVVRDSFPHAPSAQRVRWLATGLRTGTVAGCNTLQQ